MIKSFLFAFSLVAAAQALGHGGSPAVCQVGWVAYDSNMSIVYDSGDLGVQTCRPWEKCYHATFNNLDEAGYSFVETGFCTGYTDLDCQDFPNVGNTSNCNITECTFPPCRSFTAPICNVGLVTYDMSKSRIFYTDKPRAIACSLGSYCGMYRFYSSNSAGTGYVESGICVKMNTTYSCDHLQPYLNGSTLGECDFTDCNGNQCKEWRIPRPLNRGFRCDQGTFVYTEDRKQLIHAIDVNSTACGMNESTCVMWRWNNVDRNTGEKTYIETGACITPFYNPTCEDLKSDPLVGEISNCTVDQCTGDFCTESKFLETKPGCPARAPENDIQILPGCTVKEALHEVGHCMESLSFDAFNDSTQCRNQIDGVIQCLGGIVQSCLEIAEDGTFCSSALDAIPGIANIYSIIGYYTANITSTKDIKNLLTMLFNSSDVTNQLDILDNVCAPQFWNVALANLTHLQALLSGINFPYGMPFCSDNMIVNDLIRWGLDWGIESLSARSLGEACLSFNKLKALLVDASINRCYNLDGFRVALKSLIGDYFAGLTQKAVNIVKEFFVVNVIPGCEGVPFPSHQVCKTGTVVYTLDKEVVYSSNKIVVEACDPGVACGMTSWIQTNPDMQNTNYLEHAFCNTTENYYRYTCKGVRQHDLLNQTQNCTSRACNKNSFENIRCLKFTADKPVACPEQRHNDLAILPQCSAHEGLERVFGCMGGFMGEFPYSDTDECRNDLDAMVMCFSRTLSTCLSGICKTVLDDIPAIRFVYAQIIPYASRINSLRDFLKLPELNLNLPDETIEGIYYLACHEPGSQLPTWITDLIRMIPPIGIGSPVCDNNILDDLIKWGVTFATKMFEAREHQDLCMLFSTFKNNLTNAWTMRCDANQLHFIFTELFTGDSAKYIEIIEKGIPIATDFLLTLEIPNCDNRTVQMPDCSQFYNMEGTCAMRKAWMCDYVTWKHQFLVTWLQEFKKYSDANLISDTIVYPNCPQMDTAGMCVNSGQLRCATSGDGCPVCFCMDHNYADMNNILSKWRVDYQHWRTVMMKYTEIMNYGTTSGGGGTC